MQRLLLTFLLAISLASSAQYTTPEIKKYKISKITKWSVSNDADDAAQKQEIFYDRNGNDTAAYNGGKMYKRSLYEYNHKGQIIKRINSHIDSSAIETGLYTYQPDGSYKISNTDKAYGMTDYEWYDKTGKLTKSQSPDRAQRLYAYDAKGKLVSVKTKAGRNEGINVDLKYTYNSRGQLVKEVSSGEYKWTTTFSYNEKGLLTKTTTITSEGAVESKTVVTYDYECWK
jgi:YD repeat-containing protein